MSGHDLLPLLPLIALAGGAVVVLVALTIRRSHALVFALTLVTLATAMGMLFVAARFGGYPNALLTVDCTALYFIGLILGASFVVAMLSQGYLRRQSARPEEFYILLLLATLGAGVLVASTHFASFFLGLEILSVSLYSLVAYRRSRRALEAGVKYLVLAGTSSAFLLLGMAFIYSQTGTMELGRLSLHFDGAVHLVMFAGLALVMVAVGFKLALVPFHLWTPDVYQGAPAPVSAFIATVSKGAVLALLLRYAGALDLFSNHAVMVMFAVLAILSMFTGNLLAVRQNNVKRLLAYSSISHLGYLLVALIAGGPRATVAVGFYLGAYFVTTLGAFGVVTVLSTADSDADSLTLYRGLFYRRPALAAVLTVMLLSLGGIPLTAGFVGKFLVLRAGAGAGAALWALSIVLVVSSVIGLYYYLRVIVVMCAQHPHEKTSLIPAPQGDVPRGAVTGPVAPAAAIALTVLTAGLIFLGVWPGPLIDLIAQLM